MIGLGAGVVALLATAGLSYTLWTQSITQTSNVSTGSMDVHYTGTVLTTGTSTVDKATLGGNDNGTGSCTGAVSKTPQNTATVTITNGYPGFTCNVDFPYTNDGTVLAISTGWSATVGGDNVAYFLDWFYCSVAPGQTVTNGARISIPTSLTDHMAANETVSFVFTYANYYPGEVGFCGTYTPDAAPISVHS